MENTEKRVEKVTLDDGRLAERRIFQNEEGNEVIELHVEPKKHLNLTKRVINEKKEVVSRQRIQSLKNGEVVEEEVHSLEPDIKLEKREHIVKENINDEDYVTNDKLNRAIAEGVVTGLTPLIEKINTLSANNARDSEPVNMEPKQNAPFFSEPLEAEVQSSMPPEKYEPKVSALSKVKHRVEEKEKSDSSSLALYGLIAVAQVGILLWIFFGW